MDCSKFLNRLAAFGGTPRFPEPLHVGRPNVPPKESVYAYLDRAFSGRWLTNDGPLLREFEDRLASYSGVGHCIATCNGTAAIEILARALELKGEVILPSFTFVATAHALRWQGIRPVFCDIDATSHLLDPGQVERLVTDQTTGIVGVHLWGQPCFVHRLGEIAGALGLRLMFDAAHAMGCSMNDTMVGNFGDGEVLSFHATKVMNCFEGGAILTNDSEVAQKTRWMRNFGFSGLDQVDYLGVNAKMSEASAAMGLASLDMLEQFIATNKEHADSYAAVLEGVSGLRLVHREASGRHNYHYVVVEIYEDECGISRDSVVEVLVRENILARRYFHPGAHRMKPYVDESPGTPPKLENTEAVANRVLVLPTGTAMRKDDVEAVGETLATVIEHGAVIEEHLGQRRQNAG